VREGAALSLGAAALGKVCLRTLGSRRSTRLVLLAACFVAFVCSPSAFAQEWLWGTQQNQTAQVTLPGQLPPQFDLAQDQQTQDQQGDQQKKGPYVERIEFQGNRRFRRDTLLARIFTRQGDPYNPDSLNRDFQALWNTGYFDDVTLSVEDSPNDPNGRIVIFNVKERRAIRQIKYVGNKSVSESDILDAFKDQKVGLTVESQFDPTKVKKAEVVIKELLAEHGRQYATVKATYQDITASNAVILTFHVDEGPKVKVGRITFVGNHAFSSAQIIRSMKRSRPYGIPLKLFTIDVASKTFDREKLNEDLEIGIKGMYQDAGYFEVFDDVDNLKPVQVDKKGVVKGPFPLIGSKHSRSTDITIKIEEGDRYRMGKLFIRNADPTKGLTLNRKTLESVFPLKQGDIFNVGKIRKAIESYTKIYGQFGFIDFTATPDFDIDHKNKVINLTLSFDEEKQYYVHRINISGNVTTRDKVIRRELLIDEGDLYNNRLWEISVLRLNQLDFFEPLKPETAAEVKKNVKQSNVDLNLKVREKGKQSISLTGGVSGLAGTFVGLTYQTNNFLGLGETLTLSGNVGTIQRNLTFGFTEPYLFDRPISTGFTIFSNYFNFDQAREESILLGQPIDLSPLVVQNYAQNSDGFTVFASYPIKHARFTRVALSYGYTNTSITASSTAAEILFDNLQFQSVAGASALNGIHQSMITPSITYNTVDNPTDPSKGTSIFFSSRIEGLGGNTRAITNTFDFKRFFPTYHKRNVIGIHFTGAFLTGYGGDVPPPFERFYTGGEQSIRGFDYFIVSPLVFIPVPSSQSVTYTDPRQLDGGGNPRSFTVSVPTSSYTITFPGGDTEGVFNGEYRIPLVGHYASMDFFLDVGTTGVLQRSQLQLSDPSFAALTTGLPDTMFNKNLLFAPHTNFAPRASTGIELVVNLPIVHAPFRIYYAYNVLRLNELVVAPQGDFYLSPELKNSLPPGVLDTQILPSLTRAAANPAQFNYIDPLKTVRFTVSRTF
jgi:outer membrane protein insertion porin family